MNSRLNDRGEEILDPTPVTRAIGFTRPVSTLDEMRRMYRIVQEEAIRNQAETPEEFNDFDIDEDPVPDAPFAINLDNLPLEASLPQQPAPVASGTAGASVSGDPAGGGSPGGAASVSPASP